MDITDEHDADEVDEIPWALWSQRIRDCPFADFGAATIQEAFHIPVGGLLPSESLHIGSLNVTKCDI